MAKSQWAVVMDKLSSSVNLILAQVQVEVIQKYILTLTFMKYKFINI